MLQAAGCEKLMRLTWPHVVLLAARGNESFQKFNADQLSLNMVQCSEPLGIILIGCSLLEAVPVVRGPQPGQVVLKNHKLELLKSSIY